MDVQLSPQTDNEIVPENESAQPILIRKLDRLETTGLIAAL
ncbi:MAG: hypothetical protein ABSA93_33480 [Streptosporangiaceae bacterium]|jgi:hypothetical protein